MWKDLINGKRHGTNRKASPCHGMMLQVSHVWGNRAPEIQASAAVSSLDQGFRKKLVRKLVLFIPSQAIPGCRPMLLPLLIAAGATF